jgi:S1-C subfamily serine protease
MNLHAGQDRVTRSPAAGAVSLGFAIPAATAVNIADQLLEDGTATHPYVGVSLGRLTPQIRQALDVVAESGALVVGVQPGDVIVGLAGRQIETVEDLLGALRDTEPGQQVPLTVMRDGVQHEITLRIGSRP